MNATQFVEHVANIGINFADFNDESASNAIFDIFVKARSILASKKTSAKAPPTVRCTKAKIREMTYNPDTCTLCGDHHANALEYFTKHLGERTTNFAHHDKTVEEEASSLDICGCGHASSAHRKDSLDNLLECECGQCDHFHYAIELNESDAVAD